MSDIRSGVTMPTHKQTNTTHGQKKKKQSIEMTRDMAEMKELADHDLLEASETL